MRLYGFLLTTSVLFATARAAANESLAQLAAELPTCSLGCIISGLSSSGLGDSNLTATCTDEPLQASLSRCIQSECNATEQFKVAAINQELCAGTPFASRTWLVAGAGLGLGLLALLAIALRCYSRLRITKEFGNDDIIMVIVGVFLAATLVLDVKNALDGFGRHFWDLNPLRIPSLLKTFWVSELFYIVVSTLVRVSILIFYLRIFPKRSFKIGVFVVTGLVIATGIAVSFVILFQCKPVAGAWNRLIKAKCINLNSLAYATGGISITLDIIVLVLPIPQVLRLKTNLKKKINVMIMFSVGSLACITSFIRLKFIINFSNSVDQTWDNVMASIWSMAEICVATICACLPAIRILLANCLPSVFHPSFPAPSTFPYRSGSNQNSSYSPQSRHNFRHIKDKISPAYNKRPVDTPNEDLLPERKDDKQNSVSTKIWIRKPHFEDVQDLVASPNLTQSRFSIVHDSHSTEMFAIEGPRVSNEEHEEHGFAEEGNTLKVPMECTGGEKEVTGIKSLEVNLGKELPAVPPNVVRRERNRELGG